MRERTYYTCFIALLVIGMVVLEYLLLKTPGWIFVAAHLALLCPFARWPNEVSGWASSLEKPLVHSDDPKAGVLSAWLLIGAMVIVGVLFLCLSVTRLAVWLWNTF